MKTAFSLSLMLAALVAQGAPRGAINNVPEAAKYTLVYSLDIPNAANYSAGITYTVDQRADVSGLSRVAYYLELGSASGTNFIWVSMDALTNNVNVIGVPTVSSGAIFQQPVANMNVLSSVPSIVNGNNLQGGNIEFWPSNYSAPNALGVPNASDAVYDWGDTRTAGNHGSMQLHNADASQVLFAFNNWGGAGGNGALGIGNATTGANPDWTFAANTANYTVKTLQVWVVPIVDPTPPELTGAVGLTGLTNVVVNFSKSLDDSATNAANYSISGGVSVLRAALSTIAKNSITLTTSAQQPLTSYTLTVNGVKDRTPIHVPLPPNTVAPFRSSIQQRGATNNVPEASQYTLVYSLNIPTTPNYLNGVTYNTDLRAEVSGLSRVAYYLELQKSGGPVNFLWVSIDAVTNNVNAIGVPTLPSGAFFQQPVANMNVFSSVADIVTGTTLQGGNIEFWPSNYAGGDALGVPNATGVFDWGDTATAGNYGSMQVHNADASQVLFAFNRWGGAGGNADLGIGNDTVLANPDWTFAQNAADYTLKTLQVYVVPKADPTAPVLVSALGLGGLTNVTVTFSKAMDESATNAAGYSVSSGVSVLSGTLDPVTKATVTLTTTPQQASTPYVVSVNGVKDRTPLHVPVAANSTISFTSSPSRGVFENVPEAANYSLVYSLDIPNAPNYLAGLTYNIDLRTNVTKFNRVAYYMELQQSGGPLNYIWVSIDPVTADVNQIGVPTVPAMASVTDNRFQQPVANMNVRSSAPGIVNGNNLQGGNIEFWPSNYSAGDAAGVPNASSSLYDWGDTATAGNYGSMQIHNADASQVLFAFNRWGGNGSPIDIGIGNAPSGNPDYTFVNNGNNQVIKTLQVFVLPANNAAPAISSAVGLPGGTKVVLTFTKAVDDSATNAANYSISGGVSVLQAVVEPLNKLAVTLTTTPQQPLTPYTVTVNNVRERSASRLAIVANSTAPFTSFRQSAVLANVPEAVNYSLVYWLDIPNAPNYSAGISYLLDQRAAVAGFNRVAYYLELQTNSGPLDFLWVSLDAFTPNVNRIGVPTVSSGAFFQQNVTNMNVLSSVASIVTGNGIQTGNMEFWPSNYGAQNTLNVPNASATTIDWGDGGAGTSAGYGSMQIHNYGASQVLFAFNRWGGAGGNVDLGIGNATVGANPDWTFAQNAATYTVKSLQVFVLPTPTGAKTIQITTSRFTAAGQFSITWESAPGTSYSVLKKLTLGAASWTKAGTVTATGTTTAFIDAQATDSASFYRISAP